MTPMSDTEKKPVDLSVSRARINEIDSELRTLFLERMDTAADVAAYKRASGMAVLDSAREQAVLDRLCDGLDSLQAEAVTDLWKQIFEISRAHQHRQLCELSLPRPLPCPSAGR